MFRCGTRRLSRAGVFIARFDRIEPVDLGGKPADAYVFVVTVGDEAGSEVRRIVSRDVWVGNSAHGFLSQLIGHTIEEGEDVDPMTLFGSSVEVVTVAGASGNGAMLKSIKLLTEGGGR